MSLISINPADGEKIAEYTEISVEETEAKILGAQRAFESWRGFALADRSKILTVAKEYLLQNKERFAKLMAMEMGKPIAQGHAEIEKCASVCEYYARHAGEFLNPQTAPTDAAKSYVAFEPLGVVLAIMPWNFPFWQVFRFAAPALMAGNAALLKHASNVSGCSLAIEEVFRESGFPSGLFQSLMISHDAVPAVIGNSAVRAITLTGSNRAGEEVAAQAGALLKKTVMELGGSDPFVVLADADLERAVEIGVQSRLNNSGQSCISAKRFIIVEEVREEFERRFIEAMSAVEVGDPVSEATKLGPMARRDLRDELQRQVEASLRLGAQLRLGGKIPEGPGCYYPPTVISGVRQGMPVFDEEVFGPVAPLISARDEVHAIELANGTPFGLGAAVFTRDLARGEKIAREFLNAGSCFVNAMVKSDPRLPFGGIKASGYGRELSSFGIREFVNIKTVSVAS